MPGCSSKEPNSEEEGEEIRPWRWRGNYFFGNHDPLFFTLVSSHPLEGGGGGEELSYFGKERRGNWKVEFQLFIISGIGHLEKFTGFTSNPGIIEIKIIINGIQMDEMFVVVSV